MLIALMQLPLTRRSDKRWLQNYIIEKVSSALKPATVGICGLPKCGGFKPDANISKTLPYLLDVIFPEMIIMKLYDRTSYFRSKT
jgi:hypothetical protein